jgi:hypothetical protein
MIRSLSLCLMAAAALCSSACCLPEAKVQWSPDGRWAAVLAPDGLYLSDADGALSPLVAPGVKAAAWTPDSKRLVVLRRTALATWKEVTALFPEAETPSEEFVAGAKRLKAELLAHEGSMDKFEPKSLKDMPGALAILAIMYLRDVDPAGLPEKLGPKWEELKKVEAQAVLLEVGDVAEGVVKFGPHVAKTFDDLTTLRLSPDGKTAACVGIPAAVKAEGPSLLVVAVSDGKLREVAECVSSYPDWSSDGRFIVYAHAATTTAKAGGKDAAERLGTISRREVAGADGALLEKFADAEDLASLLFNERLEVRCLADGRVLFNALAVNLPCAKAEWPKSGELFALNMKATPAVGRVLSAAAPEKITDNLMWFEVSPDQKRALIQTPQGISIVSLADGRVEATIAESPKDLLNLPVWRTSDEVCLAVSAGSKIGSAARSEIVLWSATGTKVLTKSWPDKIVKGLLEVQQGTPTEEKKPGEAAPAPASPPPTGPKPAKPAP